VSAPALLTVDELSMRFGGLLAVDSVSFEVAIGQIAALIGPNGAGKTTVFNCVTGFYRPTAGEIELARPSLPPLSIERLAGYRIARAGVARTFQNIRLFPRMTALENLLIARHTALAGTSPISSIAFSIAGLLGLPQSRRAEREAIALARDWLDRIGLVDASDREAGTLPYGAQRRLEIARAMCTEPLLLCLDEPAAGLNDNETAELARLLRDIRERQRIGILLIEHDMGMVMGLSDHVVVLDHGRVIADGTPTEVRGNPAVIRAYLGEEEDAPLPPVIVRDIHDGDGR
jgi:branched-chain amino acid transport system ATP-binding protein